VQTGKKKLKAINRALRTVHQTPRLRKRGGNVYEPSPFDAAPKYTYINRNYNGREATLGSRDPDDLRTLALANSQTNGSGLALPRGGTADERARV
jgi:hypothetical protein